MAWYTLKRQAARVVLLDPSGRTLLLRGRDPADRAKPPWWELPGGGIDGRETSADAARRELREETGLGGSGIEIGPCVWRQHSEFDFGGYHFDQDEFIHVAWCDAQLADAPWAPAGLEALEAVAFGGIRWWPLDDLVVSREAFIPARLITFLPALVAGKLPAAPIDIGALAATEGELDSLADGELGSAAEPLR